MTHLTVSLSKTLGTPIPMGKPRLLSIASWHDGPCSVLTKEAGQLFFWALFDEDLAHGDSLWIGMRVVRVPAFGPTQTNTPLLVAIPVSPLHSVVFSRTENWENDGFYQHQPDRRIIPLSTFSTLDPTIMALFQTLVQDALWPETVDPKHHESWDYGSPCYPVTQQQGPQSDDIAFLGSIREQEFDGWWKAVRAHAPNPVSSQYHATEMAAQAWVTASPYTVQPKRFGLCNRRGFVGQLILELPECAVLGVVALPGGGAACVPSLIITDRFTLHLAARGTPHPDQPVGQVAWWQGGTEARQELAEQAPDDQTYPGWTEALLAALDQTYASNTWSAHHRLALNRKRADLGYAIDQYLARWPALVAGWKQALVA